MDTQDNLEDSRDNLSADTRLAHNIPGRDILTVAIVGHSHWTDAGTPVDWYMERKRYDMVEHMAYIVDSAHMGLVTVVAGRQVRGIRHHKPVVPDCRNAHYFSVLVESAEVCHVPPAIGDQTDRQDRSSELQLAVVQTSLSHALDNLAPQFARCQEVFPADFARQ